MPSLFIVSYIFSFCSVFRLSFCVILHSQAHGLVYTGYGKSHSFIFSIIPLFLNTIDESVIVFERFIASTPAAPICNHHYSVKPWGCHRFLDASSYLYLGNKCIARMLKHSFIVCEITKYDWQWVLIFSKAFLSLNYSSHPSGHQFVKEIEVLLGQTFWAIFSVQQ